MADYWKKKLEELNKSTKKTSSATKTSSSDYWKTKLDELDEEEKKKAVAPVKSTAKTTTAATDDRKWFEKGAFADGYQFGDITKTIGGTLKDAEISVMAGIIGMGEKAVDAGAYAVGAVGGLFSDDFKQKTQDFIKKDLYDERAVAEKIVNGRNPITMLTKEKDSVLGAKTDSVMESGGQLLGTAALQAVGVPWYLTTGVTSFGSETENAFNQGAGYGEAGLSAAISAGAEILTEKISGGIKFGGSTLDDTLTKKLALGVSSKALRTMSKLGMDIAGEGSEEVLSQFFSNLGTSLYRDESLSDILFSEEALDEYLESFIGGAALGGAGGGFNAVNSAVNGVDATSGMTENEEKVFKKVYEDRIAEAEKDGEKLTAKEKNKIYEEVENDLEKGYISTDTIEEVLGGETYNEYKNTTDSENALREEFETLGAMKKSDFTAKQEDRYNDLKQKLAEIDSGDARNQLKTKLSGEVMSLAEGSRLAESYNERARRGEKFDADLTAYDEKQKAVVQKAIDSGILNNTNRTHEFVDMVAKISADKGVLFDFTNNTKLKDSGFALDGKTVNGFVSKDGVTVNIDSQKSLNSVVGHEITHVLEGTELYNELHNTVVEYAKTKGDYQGRYDSLAALYKGVEGADIDAELTADLIGDYLFTDADFVNNLSVKNRNVFQKIYDEIKYLYKVATAGSKEARELAKVKRAFDKAYKDGGAVDGTKYSISGVNAQTADSSSLLKAEHMLDAGADSETVRQETGWYRGYDGKMRFEVDDSEMRLKPKGITADSMQLDELIDHPTLFKAYPDLSNVRVIFSDNLSDGENGLYNPMFNQIVISDKIKNEPQKTLIHEIQHIIQNMEGFSSGSSPEYWKKVLRSGNTIQTVEQRAELRESENKLYAIYKRNPNFYNEMVELLSTTPDTPRGKVNFETLENVEEDPIEWQEFDKKRDALEEKYGADEVFGFIDLHHDVKNFANRTLTADDAYYRTAGEIEARDTANRLNLNAEQRRSKRPDIDSKNVVFTTKYSLSDSDGKQLTAEQGEYFKDSKMRDENGNLKVMYHGSQDAGFHEFDASMSDDDTSFFFVDRNDVAASYSGTTETYEAQSIRTAEDMNRFMESIDAEGYEVVEKDGKFVLLYEGERVADSRTAKGIYDEFCWYEGVGQGDANYKVYLNLTNPLEIDAKGRPWNKIDAEFSQEVYDRYQSLTAEEKDALVDLAEWEDFRMFNSEIQTAEGDALASAYAKMGEDCNIYDLFSVAADSFSEESMRENARKYLKTRDFAARAKAEGYDGVIFKNIVDNGGYSNGSEGASTVAIAFDSEQIKSVANEKPTKDPDIRYSLSKDGETPKAHGRYHIKGEDVALDVAPVQDSVQDSVQDVAPVSETEKVVEEATATEPKERRLAWYNRWGEKVSDVPVMEDIAPSEPSLPQLREELADIEQRAKEAYAAGDIDALTDIGERHTEITAKIGQMEAEESERVASLDDADAPPEVDAPYQNEGVAPADPFADRDIKDVGDRKVKAYMYENPEVKPFFQEEANILLGELRNTTKGERFYTPTEYSSEYGAESYGVWTGTSRQTTDDISYLLDTLKYSYAEIEKGLNAIIEDNGKENNAISKRIEFLLNDRLMKGHADIDGHEIPPNQDYINLLNEKQITEYTEEARRSFFESVGATEIAPVKATDDIAPTYHDTRKKGEIEGQQTMDVMRKGAGGKPFVSQIKGADDIAPTFDTKKRGEAEGQQTILDESEGKTGKIAKVMVGEPDVPQKKVSGWQKFRTNFLDKFSVFEDLALKTKNRELMGKANFMLSSEARAQHMIGKGTGGVKSLNDVRAEVEKTGQKERFYNYMYHLHNIDRMSLEDKARPVVEGLHTKFGHLRKDQLQAIAAKKITEKTTEKTAQSIRDAREYLKAIDAKNKPVFGDDVTAEMSREQVAFYEKSNPEFKAWAQDVYTYMNHLRGLMVQNGVISQETADLWAEMYPHYVPIRRLGKSGLAVNVPLDTGRTGVNAPIKRAVGGNSDIMDMFDTMALRTEQTFRAIAKNSFGVELKNTLGTTLEKSKASLDEVIDSIDTHEELLKKGENGANPTFTVFENGERVEFEITDAMYDALRPTSEGLKYVNPVANTISKVHKGILTEYNPVFSLTNAIKDAQDILINSKHAVKTYANVPNALWQMAKGGKWYNEYIENGGEQNTYFDNQKNAFKAEDKKWKKVLGLPLRGISYLNNTIERVPRLAEYIASRKGGESVEVAMLDAARVTTNFSAGGDVAKFADRNGATFLNASIQGFNQQVRNVREAKANGLKGWLQLAAKTAIAGIPALILNDLLWDDDEEYEELSDYVKDNYYIVAKFGDGKFVRIPKGRTLAVIQDAFEQVKNALTGDDEVDLRNFLDIAFTNLAPNNPWDNNIIAPIRQAVKNKAWYGGDIVPTRLQDMPSAEQYDESTDSISKWLGEHTNTSPMKWNYVLNQYGGGLADMSLPYLTPEAESGGNKLIAPLADKFTTDAVMNNQNVTDFYDTVDELTKNANSAKATDEDILKSKYMNSVNSELSALYQQKREIQNSGLPDKEKYAAVREVQKQIDSMTAEGLNTYGNVNIDGVYATVGDRHYRMNKEGAWEKITDKQLEKQNEVTSGLGISASDYWSNKDEYDFEYEYPEKYTFFRENGISYEDYANADEDGKRAYTWAAENPEKYVVSKAVTGDLFEYRRYTGELYDIKADKDEDGESISGSAKEKKTEYINNLDLDYGQKIILYRSLYDSRADQEAYNQDIVDYLNEREDISYEEMETILKELGFEVDSEGNISW